MRQFQTPMMRQYWEIKEQYQDCLLFFRLGDFYELFLDDAIVGAKVLDITLTRRPRGKDGHIPMAGVPYHAADGYIAKLVAAGYKVAICEQVSEPDNKGIVERDVVRIVTPGTILDEKSLDRKSHNYTWSIWLDESESQACIGLAAADVSTGDFQVMELPVAEKSAEGFEIALSAELMRFGPAECVLDHDTYGNSDLLRVLSSFPGLNVYPFDEWQSHADDADSVLKDHFKVKSLEAYGIDDKNHIKRAAAALVGYLRHTQRDNLNHIRSLKSFKPHDWVGLNRSTITSLELFTTMREGERRGSLLSVIDETTTPMGGRLLRSWLTRPLTDKGAIEDRLDAVEELLANPAVTGDVRNELTPIYDIERILSRLSVGLGTAVDLVNLKHSINHALSIRSQIEQLKSPLIQNISELIVPELVELAEYLDTQIVAEPPVDLKSGNIVRKGVNAKVDELRKQVGGGKEWLLGLERSEREKTGINSLKIKYNQVFGYYLEVSKANLHLVPDRYIRKQTMVGAERFITPELKEYEQKILTAEDELNKLEYDLFVETVATVLTQTDVLQDTAKGLASIDVLAGFAHLAERQNYIKPTITDKREIKIKNGRHPVVETLLASDKFVPNDTLLNTTDHQLLVMTGPNMAGKSVFARQVALITLLAHVGSFVPADEATISIVDSIFVRSGAADVITAGLSTFMVEMVETAHILHHATDRSLIIMDEIGRGTSTYDGISIAWAIAEYLVTNRGLAAKTIFATHYHELQQLAQKYPKNIKNYQVLVDDNDGEPIFLHKVIEGGADSSFGVAVARLAGVPDGVTEKAEEVLTGLEQGETKKISPKKSTRKKATDPIVKEIKKLDLENLTPREALDHLYRLQQKIHAKG